MKTLAQRHDMDEVLSRLANVRPDSPRQWGHMSAPQMICHLSDAFRMAGEKPLPDDSTLAQRTLIKWMALYAPLPWPTGKLVTRPEIDQVRGGGCSPGVFADDVARLVTLVAGPQDRLARASLLRRDVLECLAAVGLPAHGSPPAPVRGIACDTGGAELQFRSSTDTSQKKPRRSTGLTSCHWCRSRESA
jgi:hypothetical protein